MNPLKIKKKTKKTKLKKYISTRVVLAENLKDAIEKVINCDFDDSDMRNDDVAEDNVHYEYKKLKAHAGHDIECVRYGKKSVAIECCDCNEILISYEI
jgi:hypothetical protein